MATIVTGGITVNLGIHLNPIAVADQKLHYNDKIKNYNVTNVRECLQDSIFTSVGETALQRMLLSSAAASSERASPGHFNTFPFLQELHERRASYSSKTPVKVLLFQFYNQFINFTTF